MKSLSLVVIFLFVSLTTTLAQGENNSLKGVPPNERVVFGGGLGGGFSSTQDFVMLSPSLGYMLTRKLMGGVSFTYRYTKYKYVTPNVSFNDYGVAPFARFMIFNNLFLHTEYEYLNYQFYETRKAYNSFLAGGGFVQPVGNNASLYFIALYNFSYQTPLAGQYSPYSSPLVIRAGINVGMFGN